MSENPRLWLAFMWSFMALTQIATGLHAVTPGWRWVNLLAGFAISPALAFLEARQGLRERKARKAFQARLIDAAMRRHPAGKRRES